MTDTKGQPATTSGSPAPGEDDSAPAPTGSARDAITATGRAAGGKTSRRSAWWQLVKRIWVPARFVIGIGLGFLALYALNGQRGELTGATSTLGQLHTSWLVLGIISEVASIIAFAAMQGLLLRCGGVVIGIGRMFGITMSAGAIASSLPAGPGFSSVFAFRQYRRGGADEGLALWTLLTTLTCASLSLALLATAGVGLAEQEGSSFDLIGVILGVLVLAVLAWIVVGQRHLVVSAAGWVIHLCQRVTGRPRRHRSEIIEATIGRLQDVDISWHELLQAVGWGLANWCLDCGCLACCFPAVGAAVPWRGLLLAYGAAQLAANLPITPGGLGVVEGSLTIALVAFGGFEPTTVAAVLLYRIISFWGFLPLGWAAWGGITWGNRRHDHRPAKAAVLGAQAELAVTERSVG